MAPNEGKRRRSPDETGRDFRRPRARRRDHPGLPDRGQVTFQHGNGQGQHRRRVHARSRQSGHSCGKRRRSPAWPAFSQAHSSANGARAGLHPPAGSAHLLSSRLSAARQRHAGPGLREPYPVLPHRSRPAQDAPASHPTGLADADFPPGSVIEAIARPTQHTTAPDCALRGKNPHHRRDRNR